MNKIKTSFSFLTVGKTVESKEATEFKRYIGVGASKILAVNPTKAELDKIMGYESQNEPEYTGSDDDGDWARITFIVETDPNQCNGIDIKNRVSFTVRNTPAYNRDKTKVQVIDDYDDARFILKEDAEAGKAILNKDGSPARFGKYRIAKVGEVDLTHFLRAYLCVEDAFTYTNGTWTLKDDPSEGAFKLDNFPNLIKGDISEVKEALNLQPDNKVKLLYGVRTNDEGKQYQAIATRDQFVLKNNAGSKALAKLEKNLSDAKANGSYASTEFKVQELAEYNVEPTNLDDSKDAIPWD